jgi:hypothetical protein
MDATDLKERSAGPVDELVPGLPLEDYKQLTVARVLPRIAQMSPSQLRLVLDFERHHGNRQPVLDAIQHALTA